MACILSFFLLATALVSSAEDLGNPNEAAVDQAERVIDDKRSPQAAARGFMRAAEQGDFALASQYLDLRYLPEELEGADGKRLAEQLYIVLSREAKIDFDALSSYPEGLTDDGLPSYRDALSKIVTNRGLLTIYLQQVPGVGDVMAWKVSNATVAEIPALYQQFGYSYFVERFREFAPQGSFLGAEYFKWIFAVAAALVGVLVWLPFAILLGASLTRGRQASRHTISRYLTRPVSAVIFAFTGFSLLKDLGLGETASRIAEGGTVIILVTVWLLFATINLLRDLYTLYLQAQDRESGLMLIGPVTTTLKVLVATLAIVIWLDNIGISVTTLIAGLGVGGLAVALVVQKPLEDILGAMTLYTQQPVSVGQVCTSGTTTGVIEEISLRSTRVRKLDNSVVIIPNSVFATASIENISARKRILHRQTVRLALDTTQAQIMTVLEKLRDLLGSNDMLVPDTWRVRLVELGEFSINVEIFAQVNTTDIKIFLEVAESLNLGAIGVLNKAGVKLAVPSR